MSERITAFAGPTDEMLRIMFPGIEHDRERLAERRRQWLEQKNAEYAERANSVFRLVQEMGKCRTPQK